MFSSVSASRKGKLRANELSGAGVVAMGEAVVGLGIGAGVTGALVGGGEGTTTGAGVPTGGGVDVEDFVFESFVAVFVVVGELFVFVLVAVSLADFFFALPFSVDLLLGVFGLLVVVFAAPFFVVLSLLLLFVVASFESLLGDVVLLVLVLFPSVVLELLFLPLPFVFVGSRRWCRSSTAASPTTSRPRT